MGVLGTALTPDQIKRLSGFTSQLTLLFDGDRAGRKAALRSCEMLLTRGLACTVVLMPEGEDIDSLLRTQGVEAFEALQAQAPDGLRFCLDVLRALAPRETVEWAKNFLRHVEVPGWSAGLCVTAGHPPALRRNCVGDWPTANVRP